MTYLVDSHCHLTLLEQDLNEVLANARKYGVGHILCVSIDLDTYPRILELAKQYRQVSASVGVHPNTGTVSEPAVEELSELAADTRVVAVGESGLDYYRNQCAPGRQQDRFRNHIRAARHSKKPLIIHNRNSGNDLLQILEEEGAEEVGGVMHCFVDDWHTAKRAMDLNFYISFSGILTFKNARAVQEVAGMIPLDRLLVETDSPYLAPVPFRGKSNQPAYVYYVADYLARLHGLEFERMAEQTTENFFRLFTCADRSTPL